MPYSMAYSKENKIAIELTCEWSGNGVRIEIEKENRERATEEKPKGRLGQQAKRKPEPDEEETNPKTTRKEHAMNTKTTTQQLAQARNEMQYLININSPLRERQERLINHLKNKLAANS